MPTCLYHLPHTFCLSFELPGPRAALASWPDRIRLYVSATQVKKVKG